MKHNLVQEKSFAFALLMIQLSKELKKLREFVISKQLLRSGTSIGANIEEAIAAETRKDFLHKIQIALKEARETKFWLRLLASSFNITSIEMIELLDRNDELIRLLSKITKTTRNSLWISNSLLFLSSNFVFQIWILNVEFWILSYLTFSW